MLQKIAPILNAYNLSETNLFYKNKLKFLTWHYGNYLVVKKDLIEIHYITWAGKDKFVPSSCYLYADNIEDLYAKFSSMDVISPKGNFKDNPWGKKEFQILDNNENVLRFGEGN